MSKKTIISKGNYVGLTIELEQVKPKELMYRHESMYKIVLQYIDYNQIGWDHGDEIDDHFSVVTKDWFFKNPSEAMAKFQQIRNQVRGLGKFRNLNKRKIPDYRDSPN